MLDLGLNYLSPNMSHPLNKGLSSWWLTSPANFGGLLWRDIMPSSKHGLRVNGPKWGSASGRSNSHGSLSLVSASSQYVTHESNIGAATAITILFWVKDTTASAAGNRGLISKGASGFDDFVMWRKANNVDIGLYFETDLGTSGNQTSVADVFGSGEDWHQIGFSWSATSGAWDLIVDGAVDKSGARTGNTLNNSDATLAFGAYSDVRLYSDANIDDMRIYNRKLSVSEYAEVYNESKAGHSNTLNRISIPSVRAPSAAVTAASSLALLGVGA